MKELLLKLRAWISRVFRLRRPPKLPEDLLWLVNALGVRGQDGGYEVRDRRPYCEIAYEALLQRGDAVIPALILLLKDDQVFQPIQARVYEGTANYRDIYSYEQQPDPFLARKLAIRLLGELRASMAVDLLVNILQSPAWPAEHRLEARQALIKIGTTNYVGGSPKTSIQDETDKK